MTRRIFLNRSAGLAAGAAMIPTLSHAQALPEVRWRLTSSYPKSLDTIYGATDFIAKAVSAATGGRFQIKTFAGGEIVPGLQVLDAVQNGTVECGQTATSFYFGKDPTFAFSTALPFGMNARQQNAWLYHGGGLTTFREFLKEYNVINFPAGNTGGQMGGWYRKEIKTVADLKGLKLRIAGLGGAVMAKLGVVPQQIAGGDVYPALEKGTIDAAEWVGPYDDEKLGFNKVAKYYYAPGFWEGCAQIDLIVNLKAWEALPKEYQAVLEAAAAAANLDMLSKYDALNMNALKRLVAGGAQLRAFSNEILTAAYRAAHEIYDEYAAKNAKFRAIYQPWLKFRNDQVTWFSVDESRFDSFMYLAQRTLQRKS